MNKRTILLLLAIGWTITGFVFQLDLTQQWGCVFFPETYLIPYRVSFLIISLAILEGCIFLQNEQLRLKLLGAELGFWLFIFLFIKGGYSIGFGGTPDETIAGYDLIALFLRLFNFSFFYEHLSILNTIGKKILITTVATIILIIIKVNLFSSPIISLF